MTDTITVCKNDIIPHINAVDHNLEYMVMLLGWVRSCMPAAKREAERSADHSVILTASCFLPLTFLDLRPYTTSFGLHCYRWKCLW